MTRNRCLILMVALLATFAAVPGMSSAAAQSVQRARTEQGRGVILRDNGTWVYAVPVPPSSDQAPVPQSPAAVRNSQLLAPSAPQPPPAPQPSSALSPPSRPSRAGLRPIQRPRDASATLELRRGNFRFWFNPAKWRPAPENADGRVQLQLRGSEAYIVVIPEGTPMPISQLKTLALENANQSGANARVASEELRTLGGREVLSLQIHVTVNNAPVVFLGYYFGDPSGSIQVVGYAGAHDLPRLRAQITEGLDGLDLNR